MRIDAHQHFWTYDASQYPWIGDNGFEVLKRDFLPAHLRPLLDQHGIDGTVAVQARQDLEETEWLLDLARDNAWIRGVVGWVDLRSDHVDEDIERLRAHEAGERLVAIRHVVQEEPAGFLDADAFRAGIAKLAGHGLAYDVLIYERQMAEAIRFCAAFPEQRFVLDHVGKPRIADGAIDDWAQHMRALGALENVTCKISGLVTEADHAHWTFDQLRAYIDVAHEAFGPERLMYGSDWPVCTLAAEYDRVHGVFEEWVRSQSGVDTAQAVRATYGLE